MSTEDSIAYIENARFLDVPVTVEDLLGLAEIHTLTPYEYAELTHRDSAALRQMNRLMRMQYVSLGDPDNELRWVEAVNLSLADYCKEFGTSKEEALADLLDSVEHYSAGSQPEMNRYAFCWASLSRFRTYDAYHQLLDDVREPELHDLLLEEYRAWSRLNRDRHDVYVNVQRAGEWYSALPLELEAQYEAYVTKRREDLAIERAILLEGGSYKQQHPVVRSAEWNAYLKNPLWWPVGEENRVGESKDNEENDANDTVERILKFKQSVQSWLDARHAVMKALPKSQAASYDNLTADYHWTIVHEADTIDPELYP